MAPEHSSPERDQPADRTQSDFTREVEKKEERKIRARRRRSQSVWFGLGMFGLVGWSVAVPTLIGLALGIWIDRVWGSRYSWTLMLLILGVALGCLNAWQWIARERDEIQEEDTNGTSPTE